MSRLDSHTAADMAKWLVGSLNTRRWSDVGLVMGGLVMLLPLALALQFPLARLAMDDDITIGLGLRLTPLRVLVTVTGVALVALGVSVAGPLPFVAFVSGPIARRLIHSGKPALLAAAVIGALVGVLAARGALRRLAAERRSGMLRDVEEAFVTMTAPKWKGVDVWSQAAGEKLVGIQPDGSTVPVEQMSTGTMGQLYFAPRLAEYRSFARDPGPLPMILDDIMETFDDTRARAALQLCAEIGSTGRQFSLRITPTWSNWHGNQSREYPW